MIDEEHIRDIVYLVADHQTNAPKLLELLMAIIKVEELDLALQRNQNFVVKYLVERRDEVGDTLPSDRTDVALDLGECIHRRCC